MALIKLQIITPVSQNNWSKSVKEVTTSEYNKWVRISNWYANIIIIYIYIHRHTHTHTHTYIYIYIYIYTHTHTYIHTGEVMIWSKNQSDILLHCVWIGAH
jgi:hypothetical protein